MALSPFRPGSLTRSATDYFVSLRRDMTTLQRQLQTGQRADSYGGLGFERRTSLDIRAKLAAMEGYQSNIEQSDLRIKVMTQHLERLNKLSQDTKADVTLSKFDLLSDGTTFVQKNAEQRFKEIIDLLNTDIAGRTLFAGRSVDKLPVESYDRIMNGDGARAGLKTMIQERTLAELGGAPGTGLGRVQVTSPAAGAVRIEQDTAAQPYGFRLDLAGATVTGTAITAAPNAGPPPRFDIAVGALPAEGDSITLRLTDADGASTTVTLTATMQPPQPGALTTTFQIGADANATATNLQAALTQAMKEKAIAVLQPRAAMKTAEEFFAATPSAPPQRLVPPFATATTTVPGTAANTLIWYNGDDDPAVTARNTAPVRIDQAQVVAAGARASEPAIRIILAQLGVLAAETFTNSKADAARYATLSDKVFDKLSDKPGNPKVSEIATELANAAATMKAAKDRHHSMESMLLDSLDGIEGVSKEEAAAGILDLQNRLQASYETTSILSRLSLVNYL
jgi:flagellin-like hook-associated protein FlgL